MVKTAEYPARMREHTRAIEDRVGHENVERVRAEHENRYRVHGTPSSPDPVCILLAEVDRLRARLAERAEAGKRG